MSKEPKEPRDWKSKLLSSSFPLEFDVAKALVQHGFSVVADYSYSRRNETGVLTDFSVDLKGLAFIPFGSDEEKTLMLELLVECKYRNPHTGTKWLFLPDPNSGDFSDRTLGYTLRVVDTFAAYNATKNYTDAFEDSFAFCYKGTEVKINEGVVTDAELKKGIAQLQYALPTLLSDAVSFHIGSHPSDNKPFMFCPILLTTAELYILNSDVTTDVVSSCDSMEGIAEKVPYLIFHSDIGPEFSRHTRATFHDIRDITTRPRFRKVAEIREAHPAIKYRSLMPDNVIRGLEAGERHYLHKYFTHFIVCSFDHLGALVETIKGSAAEMADSIEKL